MGCVGGARLRAAADSGWSLAVSGATSGVVLYTSDVTNIRRNRAVCPAPSGEGVRHLWQSSGHYRRCGVQPVEGEPVEGEPVEDEPVEDEPVEDAAPSNRAPMSCPSRAALRHGLLATRW